jgi:hypothetical protein
MRIPEPKSWEEFEQITRDALSIRWENPDLSMHGRPGQAQDGVDIYGDNHLGFVAVQCKNTYSGVKQKVIDEEISKAERFHEKIKCLYIATTAPRDTSIQKYVRTVSATREKSNAFSVQIVFWEDVTQELISVPRVFLKHYPQYNCNYNEQISNIDLLSNLYEMTCLILHNSRDTLAFYSAHKGVKDLRNKVDSLHNEIAVLCQLVESKELSIPDNIVGDLYTFIQSVSDPVTRYKCFLGVYDDHEITSIDDVKDGAWQDIERNSYKLRDNIKTEIKALLIKN